MSAFWANSVALIGFAATIGWLGLALLWRVGAWQTHPAQTLVEDEGLRVGSSAPQITALRGTDEFHLAFQGQTAFVVFGTKTCGPCRSLLRAAGTHPATRSMRLVYVGDSEEIDVEPEIARRWETYRFHDEVNARKRWRAPVSPYFHVIDGVGRIAAKGIGSSPLHLDRLLALNPAGLPSATLNVTHKSL